MEVLNLRGLWLIKIRLCSGRTEGSEICSQIKHVYTHSLVPKPNYKDKEREEDGRQTPAGKQYNLNLQQSKLAKPHQTPFRFHIFRCPSPLCIPSPLIPSPFLYLSIHPVSQSSPLSIFPHRKSCGLSSLYKQCTLYVDSYSTSQGIMPRC